MLATGVRASEAGARGKLGLRICESPLKMMMCLAYFRGPSAPQRTFPIPHGFPKILGKGRDSLCCCGNSSELFRLCTGAAVLEPLRFCQQPRSRASQRANCLVDMPDGLMCPASGSSAIFQSYVILSHSAGPLPARTPPRDKGRFLDGAFRLNHKAFQSIARNFDR